MQLFFYDNFAYREAEALIFYLQSVGARFSPCYQLGQAPLERGVSFRFDIHLRDIKGAYGFMAALSRHNIPGTFFLLASYSKEEAARLADFTRLRGRITYPVEFGLHDSPVDAYFITQKFKGSGIDYWRWLVSGESVSWFTKLTASTELQNRFHREVMDAFTDRVSKTRRVFGDFKTVASHGGEINQVFRKRVPDLGTTGQFIATLFSENWLTSERLAAAGLDADIEQFRVSARRFYQVSDGGGQIKRMVSQIREYLVSRNSAVQLLIHPYTWAGPLARTGGRRDGELSVLLGARRTAELQGGRKWYQRLRRTRLMIVRENGAKTPALGSEVLPHACERAVLVSATASDVLTDLDRHQVLVQVGQAVIVEAQAASTLQNEGLSRLSLFDFIESGHDSAAAVTIIVGKSIANYGPLVADAIENLLRSRGNGEQAPPARLAQWIKGSLAATQSESSRTDPVLERKELAYFLFSSSRRAQVALRAIDQLLPAGEISCFVDHGAGLAIVPLCLHFQRKKGIARVVCSEIKHDFVVLGRQLWTALGCENRLEYQEGSAIDLRYPGSVTVVLFAQMLYRLPADKRRDAILAAWLALKPGGLLLINELLDREPRLTTLAPLTSREMLELLPKARDRWLYWGSSGVKALDTLNDADSSLLGRSDGFLVVRKDRQAGIGW